MWKILAVKSGHRDAKVVMDGVCAVRKFEYNKAESLADEWIKSRSIDDINKLPKNE